jgi:hypothetical protein
LSGSNEVSLSWRETILLLPSQVHLAVSFPFIHTTQLKDSYFSSDPDNNSPLTIFLEAIGVGI